MSRRVRSDLDVHHEMTVSPNVDAPDTRREPPTPASATPPVGRSSLGVVLAMVGTGLLMQGAADALERTGHGSPALPLFLCGISLLFAASAWRLTGAHASRRERVWVSLVLGLGLLASYVMRHPLLLDGFDELAHIGTLARLLDSHALFPTNTILPVSPYYPGLELATAATRWLTGLPLVLDELIVLAAVRVVLVLVVFLVVERVCHSSRAGGIGVLVYAAGPQFYGFDTQYAYETLALAFAAAVVYLLFVSIDAERPRMGRLFALALGCIGALVITHHVTGWLTVGFLVVWAVGLYVTVTFAVAHPPDGDLRCPTPPRVRTPRVKGHGLCLNGCPARIRSVRGGLRPGSSESPPRSASSSAVPGLRSSVVVSPTTWILCLRPRPLTSARHWATFTGTESSSKTQRAADPPNGRSSSSWRLP